MAHADRNSAHMKGPLDYEEILLVLTCLEKLLDARSRILHYTLYMTASFTEQTWLQT